MKKKQVNFAKELDEMGKAMIEGFMKGIEKANNEQNPFDNMFSEIKNEKLEELYQNYKNIAEPMFRMKRALVDSGFSEEQALEFVIADYLDNKHIAMNEGK
ncbi:hypothetical protein [Bacillus bingmayongensis]|uniref:hypothetical protein n=1 Tax=Bacillus bingmayongensis TaxID=1150157 RepID=UPI001C8D0888|nr:hypothetical protein [Bacillus bingmayongensis]MBY0597703.1 hypothetical protein [Bacillus bingmayongensis]